MAAGIIYKSVHVQGSLETHECPVNREIRNVQQNRNSSNTDGSFTMANSNSFLNPYEILPIVQENTYFRKFSYFIMK